MLKEVELSEEEIDQMAENADSSKQVNFDNFEIVSGKETICYINKKIKKPVKIAIILGMLSGPVQGCALMPSGIDNDLVEINNTTVLIKPNNTTGNFQGELAVTLEVLPTKTETLTSTATATPSKTKSSTSTIVMPSTETQTPTPTRKPTVTPIPVVENTQVKIVYDKSPEPVKVVEQKKTVEIKRERLEVNPQHFSLSCEFASAEICTIWYNMVKASGKIKIPWGFDNFEDYFISAVGG